MILYEHLFCESTLVSFSFSLGFCSISTSYCFLKSDVKIGFEEVGFQLWNATKKFGLIMCT
jgi:hypothetical protein